ncbi:hypothetical protein ARMGADRAFT_1033779 [Armillaria gallica]|uniref:Uncharacterized protein n=1 Tax=Armillaria gallica TaxID=47427 RepID=A0A2H3DD50_ARMGA|nr:hypothetical protein ARMGADRAFT_1033779 [Armillaria gallica]
MQWISGIIQQFPPQYFVRFDRDQLLSTFSMELEGTCLTVEPWNLGPGWSGSDVLIGLKSDISVEDMTEEQIGQCWNTNDPNCSAPYGNCDIKRIEERFYTLAEEMGQTIPLNVGALEKMEQSLGGRPRIADPQGKHKYIQQVQDGDGSKGSTQKCSRHKAKKNPIWRLKVSKCASSAKHSADDEPKDIPSSKQQKVAAEVQVTSKKDYKLLLDAWKSHDSFLNPLCNLFRRASSLLTNNQRLDWEGSYKSALVVQFFIDHLGAEAALLDLQKFDLSRLSKVADLKTVIVNSSIYHIGSIEWSLLCQITHVSGALDQDNLTAILSKMPWCTIMEYDSQSLPFFGEQDTSVLPLSSTHLTSLISGGPSHISSLPFSLQSPLSNVPSEFNVHGNLKQLKLMFELLYPLLDNSSEPYSPFNTTPKLTSAARNFIAYVDADTDTWSVFRDLTSSQIQSLQSGGPFDPVNLRTSAGFFSALMEYLKDSNNPVFFIDENHWKTIRNGSLRIKGEGYFCNKWAYSNQYNNQRMSANALQYWKAASNSKYNYFLFIKEPTPFIELWDHFRKGKYHEEGQPAVKLFPQFGALQAYLLASDYAIAGLATMPTDAEMVMVIVTINSGGIKVPHQQQMNFNAFVVEHSLCKCSSSKQLNNKKFHAVEKCLEALQ